MSVVVIGMYQIPYALEVLGGVQLVYLLVVAIGRPYYLRSQNIMLVGCLLVGLVFTGMLAVDQYFAVSDGIKNYAVVGYMGLLVVVNIVAVARMVIHCKYNELAFKLLHE